MYAVIDNPTTTTQVRDEYQRHCTTHQKEADRYARLDSRIADWRLYVVLVGGLLAWLSWGQKLFSPWWLSVSVIGFITLLVWHERVVKRRDLARRVLAFYEAGLRRVEGRWVGTGVTGTKFDDPAHPYAADLDLFGKGSLFELLCTARTVAGEACLADWLRAPADPDTIRARQAAVAELRPRVDLRKDLALLGEDVRMGIDPKALAAWGAEPPLLPAGSWRVAAMGLAVGTLAAFIAWLLGYGYWPLAVLVVAGRIFEGRLASRIRRGVQAVDRPARDLRLLAELLARLESETFESPRLRELSAVLLAGGIRPSLQVERLNTILGYLAARANPFLAIVLTLALWTTHCAFAIERWRAANGPRLGRWLETVGEFEALCALATLAYEHPEDPFPEIEAGGALVKAEGLVHPLLPARQAVPNDVRLDDDTRLYIVSGSNMSGKSTLLRTVGINAVLALAGAPVRARHLRLSPLHLGASIRTQDSLQGGVSRFYAEVLRLRQVVGLASDCPPALFLLDEILHGTNSHDRRLGAAAIARALVGSGAIGLLTTHDLALARLADEPSLAAVNVHFEDQLVDGKMAFDYHLRPGVVEKSNAIALMRAVGLDV